MLNLHSDTFVYYHVLTVVISVVILWNDRKLVNFAVIVGEYVNAAFSLTQWD